MRSVLMITYYWPPTAGAAARRMFAFCRYLPEYGYQPLVLTASLPGTLQPQPLDAGRVVTVRGWDPVVFLKAAHRQTASVTRPPPPRWMEWVRLNLFIPDARVGWRAPALRKARRLIQAEKPDVIFSSAPPYTVHRVGLALHRTCRLPWVADFRDPWLENHAYNTLPRNPVTLGITRRMEAAVLGGASHIVTALDSQRALLAGKMARSADSFTTIPNGYDPGTFKPGESLYPSGRFHLSHFGTVYAEGFEKAFFEQLARLLQAEPEWRKAFVLEMIGTVPTGIQEFLRERFAAENLSLSPTTAHEGIVERLARQRVLLLLVNRGALHRYSLPSKLYEYMASGNPVLAVGPGAHEAMDILRKHYADRSCVSDHDALWQSFLRQQFAAWRRGRLPRQRTPPPAYDQRTLTGKLAACFQRLCP